MNKPEITPLVKLQHGSLETPLGTPVLFTEVIFGGKVSCYTLFNSCEEKSLPGFLLHLYQGKASFL
jgi:hypothetical protein